MGFEHYHEPADELSGETRTFARMITSLGEEAEAINWCEQRISVEKDKSARAIMKNTPKEEFKHFAMDLEWLFRAKADGARSRRACSLRRAISSSTVRKRRKKRSRSTGILPVWPTGVPPVESNLSRLEARWPHRRDACAPAATASPR